MPIAIVIIGILTTLSAVGAVQGYLFAKTTQMRVAAALAQNESDNATEIVRRNIASQIAEHVEVSDIRAVPSWGGTRNLCDGKTVDCQVTVANSDYFMANQLIDTPKSTDTPMPCNTPMWSSESAATAINVCNLSLGGELNEERKTIRIHTVIESSGGKLIASTDRLVLLRVFRLSPYAQIVGVRDLIARSSITSVSDSSGFASSESSKSDTLLRSYSPCRDLPEAEPTPISKDNYKWEEWTETGPAPVPRITCKPDSGETSHYENEISGNSNSLNSWGEHMY